MGRSIKCCCSGGLRLCICVTSILFIILLVVFIILFLTLLKPKEPKIVTQSVTLENFNLVGLWPAVKIQLNVTLGMVLTINNRNYGGFKYQDGVAYVNYHGVLVAEAPIENGSIPARGRHNISSSMTIFADKVIGNSNFEGDHRSGVLNFSASTTLHGKVSMLKYFKMKAASHSSCDISIFVQNETIDSDCKSKVRL
ncbi:hypothetical protein EZV62_026383 [Acer yangbiense]|uniref:Late embryogenesis abundant protein LEA-2 subgroup domain-containing protein n=1 Tax=Acer yangbiense TaxID=1000413 RepID=A0A5C7GRG3_9ROSI|nr:hypothetical protein EZV62_026383 [Acer yangbiense]